MPRRRAKYTPERKQAAPPASSRPRRLPSRALLAAGVLVVAVLSASLWLAIRPPGEPQVPRPSADAVQPTPPGAPPALVGSGACKSCHERAYTAWQSSQHALAMQHATEKTVLGDFKDAGFRYAGIESRFFGRDGRFFVHTDGADGKLVDFEIKYTFGVYPLQHYLVEFADGRLQALGIAWDARPRDQGGQRWFHLYPEERITHGDELHWTARSQNWNFACADCHSTDLRKNYDAAKDTYASQWSAISVSCEACHGPGARHLAWAQSGRSAADAAKGLTVLLDERKGVSWPRDAVSGRPVRTAPRDSDKEIEVCAQCHARRAQIAEGYFAGRRFLDHYRPALLEPRLYYADGQQRDEVYIWGSFLQSRMHRHGVTCADCHDPHSQKLRAPGNSVCAQCHASARYDAPAHHFHKSSRSDVTCADCHMPRTAYMVVDPRRDHRIGVPRPDQTVSLGVPNACNGCHSDRSAKWAADAVHKWYGRDALGFQGYAATLSGIESGAPRLGSAIAGLAQDRSQPNIARATALQYLGVARSRESIDALRRGLTDADALVRLGAVEALQSVALGERVALGAPLLTDPVLAVRLASARALAPAAAQLQGQARADFDRAAAEYEASERYRADRPEHRTNLASFYAELGRHAEAEAGFRSAIAMDPRFVPAYVNLADLLRLQNRDTYAIELLRQGLKAAPRAATLHHVLGLALIRQRNMTAGIAALERAAKLDPANARFAYTYGVALNSTGRRPEAIRILEQALRRHPYDVDLLSGLALFQRDAGNLAGARDAARRLVEVAPDDPGAQRLFAELHTAAPR